MKYINKYFKLILISFSSLIIILFIVISSFLLINNYQKKENENPTFYQKTINSFQDDPFPDEINIENLYKKIKFQNGDVQLSKEIIPLIIKFILQNGNFTSGKLNYGFEISNDKKILLLFILWTDEFGKMFKKKYSIKLIVEN